jgi:two-component system, OmpR family, sensor histidine kinase TctE
VLAAVAAVVLVLRPLSGISAAIAARPASDLSPIDTSRLPPDLLPAIEAMNQHMQRIEALVRQQREFLDDASHQLRTHLTTLRMQAEFARGERDPAQVHATLEALEQELQRATRSTNQLLALARSDTVALQPAAFELQALLQDVAREFLPSARARGVDLGVESLPHQAVGDAGMLREGLSNLVANAIAYAGPATVTLSAAEDALGWSISVDDNGPGLPADLQVAAGTRFARAARAGSGSGLGLAIARSIAGRHGGVLRLEPPEAGSGLRATLWWPRTPGNGANA